MEQKGGMKMLYYADLKEIEKRQEPMILSTVFCAMCGRNIFSLVAEENKQKRAYYYCDKCKVVKMIRVDNPDPDIPYELIEAALSKRSKP